MLREINDVNQRPDEDQRRWFSDNDLDLITWQQSDGKLSGFQLCYDKQLNEHAIRWRIDSGFTHHRVDDGEDRPGKHKGSPILIADGTVNLTDIQRRFKNASKDLEEPLVTAVANKLTELNRLKDTMKESPENNPNKVAQLFPKRNRYTSTHHGRTTTHEFDENNLTIEWHHGSLSGSSSALLSRLSPRLMSETSIDNDSLSNTRHGLLFMLAGFVIYFSEFNASIPLLAPALGLVGLLPLISGLKNLRPTTWTRIYDDYGNIESSIPCRKDGPDKERLFFEESLSKAIERAHDAEYNWW